MTLGRFMRELCKLNGSIEFSNDKRTASKPLQLACEIKARTEDAYIVKTAEIIEWDRLQQMDEEEEDSIYEATAVEMLRRVKAAATS